MKRKEINIEDLKELRARCIADGFIKSQKDALACMNLGRVAGKRMLKEYEEWLLQQGKKPIEGGLIYTKSFFEFLGYKKGVQY